MRSTLLPAAAVLLATACGNAAAPSGYRAPPDPEKPGAAELVAQAPFVPASYREGPDVVVPVTFPDGSTAEVAYDSHLDLVSRGVQPFTWALLDTAEGSVGCDFLILHGARDRVWRGTPIAEYEGADGSVVPFYKHLDGTDRTDYLAFEFGSWTLSVYDYPPQGARMTDHERATWARSLRGHETDDGFLVLDAAPPLRLARAGEYPSPMQLWLGEPSGGVGIWPVDACSPKQRLERSRGYANWCDAEHNMYIEIQGTDAFVEEALAARIRVRNVSVRS